MHLKWPTGSPSGFKRAGRRYFRAKGWSCEDANFPLDFKITAAKETFSIRCEGGGRPVMETIVSDMRRMKQAPNRFILMSRAITEAERLYSEKYSIKVLEYSRLNENDILQSMKGF